MNDAAAHRKESKRMLNLDRHMAVIILTACLFTTLAKKAAAGMNAPQLTTV